MAEDKIHERAQLIVDASRHAPLLDVDPVWTNSELKRQIVGAVVGAERAGPHRSDEYIEASLQIIREDGLLATPPPAQVYGAHRPYRRH